MATDKLPTRFPLFRNEPYDIPAAEPVWPEGVPGFEPEANNQDVVDDRGKEFYDRFISNVRIPQFFAFPARPDNNTGRAIIICPGGGYCGVAIDKEGYALARFFNSLGISAFVLKYRIPAPDGRHGLWQNGPLDDALRTIRTVRSRAGRYGIDQDKVGIMGFSSGGHLAMTASNLYAERKDSAPELDKINPRPDFSILIYPVISLCAAYCHGGSVTNLLGDNPSQEVKEHYSGECIANAQTPPTFLSLTEDDMVHPYNSLNYYKALQAAKVPAELHIFTKGGHGYGMALRNLAVDTWPDRLAEWLGRL